MPRPPYPTPTGRRYGQPWAAQAAQKMPGITTANSDGSCPHTPRRGLLDAVASRWSCALLLAYALFALTRYFFL